MKHLLSFTDWLLMMLLVVGGLSFAAQATYGQSSGTQTAPELNITLGEQRVKFAPTRSFQEMRLEVVNSVGEIVFTHLTTEAEFDWNLRAGNSEALVPGLYRYTLSLKFGADQSRQHTGHFIVEKGQDQIWLTANDGAEVSSTVLTNARSGGRSLAGFRSTDDQGAKRDIEGRELAEEKSGNLNNLTHAAKASPAALLGMVNRVAKFDASGLPANVMDSAITEVGGNVGIGITTPGSILEMVRPGATDVVFRMANVTRAWSVGVSGTGDFWRIRDNTAGVARLIVQGGTGNVLIGTTVSNITPTPRLEVFSATGTGIGGVSTAVGGFGGVFGATTDPSNFGVIGQNAATTGTATGVLGISASGDDDASGVRGIADVGTTGLVNGVFGSSAAPVGTGVYGLATLTTGGGVGVFGESAGADGAGIGGVATSTAAPSPMMIRIGVFGRADVQANSFAGFFDGNVNVTGSVAKASGSFKIDHPLDPANKYLYHSFVESPDMMNIYNGVATLGEFGQVEITLPDWFESLNSDYRYQLTAIGMPGPNLFVAEEIKGNQFKIAGGQPGMKVSWQVTGIRQDAYARKHRIPVEELKPETQRGTYLHPDAFGQSEEKGVNFQRNAARKRSASPNPVTLAPLRLKTAIVK